MGENKEKESLKDVLNVSTVGNAYFGDLGDWEKLDFQENEIRLTVEQTKTSMKGRQFVIPKNVSFCFLKRYKESFAEQGII